MKKQKKERVKAPPKQKKTRPVMPDAVYRSPAEEITAGSFLFGVFVRILIAAVGASAMILFWFDGTGLVNLDGNMSYVAPLTAGTVVFPAILITALLGLSSLHRTARWAVPLGATLLFVLILTIAYGNPVMALAEAMRCLYNTMLSGVTEGVASYSHLRAYLWGTTAYLFPASSLLLVATLSVTAVFSALFYSLIINGIKLPMLLLSSSILVFPIFLFNISRSNYGFALVVAFLVSVFVLWGYDDRYLGGAERRREKKQTKKEKRKMRRAEKLARRRAVKARRVEAEKAYYAALDNGQSVKEARRAKKAVLRRYADEKKAEKKRVKEERRLEKQATGLRRRNQRKEEKNRLKRVAALPKGQRAEAKKALKLEKIQKRSLKKQALKSERRQKADAREEKRMLRRYGAAGGGFAGLLSMAIAFVLVWILAFQCVNNFAVIPTLYDPISTLSAHITAVLTGGDVDLNELAKHNDIAELRDRTVTFAPFQETGQPILRVSSYVKGVPIYLRNWIGRSYSLAENSWSGLTPEEVDAYREFFGKDFSPDRIRTSFYRYLYPDSAKELDDLGDGATRSFYEAGFVMSQVSVTRLSGFGYLLYVPAYMNTDLGFLEADAIKANLKKCSLYYDGMYSSRNFRTEGSYSTVSYLTTYIFDPSRLLEEDVEALEAAFRYAVAFEKLKAELEDDRTLIGKEVKLDSLGTKVLIQADEEGNLDFSPYLTVCDRLMAESGITGNGRELIHRYVNEWSKEERQAFFTTCLEEMRYRAYVHGEDSDYTILSGSASISQLAEEILSTSGFSLSVEDTSYIRFEDVDDISYSDARTEEKTVTYTLPELLLTDESGKEIPLHRLVMAVVDYLCENMTYTKTPASPAEESAYATVLEQFLFETKEGYCIHFATAAAEILKEYGFAVRYCEGMIAPELTRVGGNAGGYLYSSVVTDAYRHAWIEVYFDGIGWMQYECVPDYYDALYPTEEDPGEGPEVPSYPALPPIEHPEETEPEETELVEDDTDDGINPYVLPIIISVVILAVIIGICLVIFSHLRHIAELTVRERNLHIKAARNRAHFDDPDYDSVALARHLSDDLFEIFEAIGASPEAGELTEAYALRLAKDYGHLSAVEPLKAFRALQRVEFGGSVNFEELCCLADYTADVAEGVWRGLNFRQRLYFRYHKFLF